MDTQVRVRLPENKFCMKNANFTQQSCFYFLTPAHTQTQLHPSADSQKIEQNPNCERWVLARVMFQCFVFCACPINKYFRVQAKKGCVQFPFRWSIIGLFVQFRKVVLLCVFSRVYLWFHAQTSKNPE